MATAPEFIDFNAEQERQFLTYGQSAQQLLSTQYSLRPMLEEIDRIYMRENNFTKENLRARMANARGNATKMQDPTIPIVMPQVESALGYMTNVFVTGYPIFGAVSSPSLQDAALQLEAIIAENSITAGWGRQLIMFFRDGLKYNIHGLEACWKQKTVASLINGTGKDTGTATPNTVNWHGNVLRRLDLYNTFFDPRVHPAEIHSEGEFAGYMEVKSRVMMKRFINDLYGKVPPARAIRALESAPGTAGIVTTGASPWSYYQPIIRPSAIQDITQIQSFNWINWATNAQPEKNQGVKYSNVYVLTTLYARVIPSDFNFNVPSKNTPQVWKLVFVNNSVLLYIERLTNAHGFIPMIFGQPLEDGLDYQTKSFANNVSDLQATGSAMLTGYMASKRRLVTDRVLYDPLRIREADINSDNPSAKIPVRPSAYGKTVSDAVYQFPYRDEQANSLIDGANLMMNWADKINNQNPAQQGQFVKGNKTRHEYGDIMAHGNMKNQNMAMMTEYQVFVPVKEIVKLNILQYQENGEIFHPERKQLVKVDVTSLRKHAVHFKMSDGMLPSDKIMSADEMGLVVQTLGSSPQLASGYNLAPAFSYMMKLRGLDLRPFEKSALQMQYEAAVAQWREVAIEAVKKGQTVPPQPPMPPELVAELQAKQQTGGAAPTPTDAALASTQGDN